MSSGFRGGGADSRRLEGLGAGGLDGDTIVATATAAGAASVAVVRLSGPRARAITEAVFTPRSGAAAAKSAMQEPRKLVLGTFSEAPGIPPFDEGMIALWRAPQSYTGEDVAEWHLHGSPRVVEAALSAALAAGARLARPGEFTRRAFLAGRMDLAQAEAVADLIGAETSAAARCAMAQLGGGLSRRIGEVREALVRACAEIEAHIDFPDEDIPAENRRRLAGELSRALDILSRLLADAVRGRRYREGARIVFAGAPNAGKSSLFNAILGRERAIVAPHPGTTRDTIEARVDLAGIPATLVDTAGLREAPGEIEALGIARTEEELAGADVVVWVLDGAEGRAGEADGLALAGRLRARAGGAALVLAVNKCDAGTPGLEEDRAGALARRAGAREWLRTSAKERTGIDALERALIAAALGAAGDPAGLGAGEYPRADAGSAGIEETPLVASLRHAEALELARSRLLRGVEGLAGFLPLELVAVDVRDAAQALGTITGDAGLGEEILDRIFSSFCIGK